MGELRLRPRVERSVRGGRRAPDDESCLGDVGSGGERRLSVEDEVVGVLGPSGGGRTTLLSRVAGTKAPTAGTVRLSGDLLSGPFLKPAGQRASSKKVLSPYLTAR
ncbi:MAG: ATP-binding cassette domain-containing protein [Salinibacter sp.]